MSAMFNPAHPGEVLKEWLNGMSVTKAASKLHVARTYLSRLLNGRASISVDMALRLASALNTTPESWLEMQTNYDLWQAKQKPLPEVERLVA